MRNSNDAIYYKKILLNALDRDVDVTGISNLSGGCIHNALKIDTSEGSFFIKLNNSSDSDMFEKEFLGLHILKGAGEIAIPEPLDAGADNNNSWILTEFIRSGTKNSEFFENFGNKLACLHKHQSEKYGLDHDNYIGRLHQYNDPLDDWIEFFTSMRLEKQVALAHDKGLIDRSYIRKFENLYRKLPDLLPVEPPSLLHGDLWGGNYMTGADGEAVLIDPAVYYGNREIELSFTRMFGGFDSAFYRSYQESYPLTPGFDKRVEIYNLYPTLVHLNMFGRSYLSGIDIVLKNYN